MIVAGFFASPVAHGPGINNGVVKHVVLIRAGDGWLAGEAVASVVAGRSDQDGGSAIHAKVVAGRKVDGLGADEKGDYAGLRHLRKREQKRVAGEWNEWRAPAARRVMARRWPEQHYWRTIAPLFPTAEGTAFYPMATSSLRPAPVKTRAFTAKCAEGPQRTRKRDAKKKREKKNRSSNARKAASRKSFDGFSQLKNNIVCCCVDLTIKSEPRKTQSG